MVLLWLWCSQTSLTDLDRFSDVHQVQGAPILHQKLLHSPLPSDSCLPYPLVHSYSKERRGLGED